MVSPAVSCHGGANGRIRTRPGSMTEKQPAQSSRTRIRLAICRPASLGFGVGVRSKMTPQDGGSDDPLANSPKSLSKVKRIRSSRTAQSRTWWSGIPGATVLTQMTSWPAAKSPSTAEPGKFSPARNRVSGRARECSLRTQGIARIG